MINVQCQGKSLEIESGSLLEGNDADTFMVQRYADSEIAPELCSGDGREGLPDEFVMMRTQAASRPDLTSKLPVDRLRKLAEKRGVRWMDSMAGRDVAYWLSDERVNSQGDITLQEWDTSLYEKSPVLAFSHEWDGLSIGAGIEWGVTTRNESEYKGKAMALRALFAPREVSKDADKVFRLVDAGFFNGISPGFKALKIICVEDPEERKKLGLGPWGCILAKNLLLEASPTLIGANAGALRIQSLASRAKSSKITADDFEFLRESERQRCKHSGEKDAWSENDSAYLRLGRVLFPRTVLSAKLLEDDAPKSVQSSDPTPEVPVTQSAAQEIMNALHGLQGIVVDSMGQMLEKMDEIGDAVAEPESPGDSDDPPQATDEERKDQRKQLALSGLAKTARALIEKIEQASPV